MSNIQNEYNEHQEEEYAEFLEFKEKRNRELGLQVDGSPLGDSVHKGTIKSYEKLKQSVPDTVRLATLRPGDRMLRMITEMKGKPPEIKTSIRRILRLKDKKTGKESLVYDKHLEFNDLNGNLHTLDYDNCNCHEEAEGRVLRDHSYKITGSEITGVKVVFDKEWSKAEFDKLLKTDVAEGKGTDFAISFTKTKGKGSVYAASDMLFSVKNGEDMVNGKFDELVELGRRGLSTITPSLSKPKQPVSEDPNISLFKKERGYISPSAISYNQTSYR
ncbi:MAG: hypothetical protein ACR2IS_02640 [Nitrososphaeraceae archaeon]